MAARPTSARPPSPTVHVQTKLLTVFSPSTSPNEIHLKISFGKLGSLHRAARRAAPGWVERLKPNVVPVVKRLHPRAITVHLTNVNVAQAQAMCQQWEDLFNQEVQGAAGSTP